MPLGTKAGLGPGGIVLHGDPAPSPKRGTAPPIFCPCLLWPNGRPSQLLLSTCFKTISLSNQPSHRGICCQSPSALHWYTRLLLPSGNRCPGRHVIFTLLSVWFNVATALSTSGAGRHRPAVQTNTMYSTQRIHGTAKAKFLYASWF